MPDELAGQPFEDGEEPEERIRRAADDFAVPFDEDFVRAATFHEPTAEERVRAAAQARVEAEFLDGHRGQFAGPARELRPARVTPEDPEYDYGAFDDGAERPYRGHGRWHRPVAWVLTVVMGIGVVALAFASVYRGAAGQRGTPSPPPATANVDSGHPAPGAPPGREEFADPSTSAVPLDR
ncbi:hypothetical protein [Streptomyces sp. NPDC005438]|uniref:SCO2584 family spore wall biosynthesis protein n=1 Tax=Streptomyces sp. NPDC005438 TaxID=3156880 RepID=UPI0033BA02CD